MGRTPRLDNEFELVIFAAALNGFVANRYFHDGHFQGSPQAAVDFAMNCVPAAKEAVALPLPRTRRLANGWSGR